MSISRRTLLGAAAALPLAAKARAQAAPVLRLGVLNDQSGPYRDDGGPTSVLCAQMAVDEFMAAHPGVKVELISADHQNKPDVGVAIARQWFDERGVDAIFDLPTSSVALAVSAIGKEKNKAIVTSGAGTSELTGKQCSPNTIQWTYDTYMLAKSTAVPLVKKGDTTWFFVTADYTFGHSLQSDAAKIVEAAGGRVVGSVSYPFPGTSDFSSFLLQGQASGAKVIGLANAGDDAANCIKQASEFGVTKSGARLAALLLQVHGVHAIGLPLAQGLLLTESYYWNLNDRTRAFNTRIQARKPPTMPAMTQAGNYACVKHYLEAAVDMGVAEAKKSGLATINRMKAMPCDDDVFGKYTIREDGRSLNPAYLFEVKKPSESHSEWDLYNLVSETPGPEAYRPMSEGGCYFIKS